MPKVPKALFNSKAMFNPYQYLPFDKIMEFKEETGQYEWNGENLFITDEVGVGKTFEVGIILRELLNNNPDLNVLILCPVKLCSNWEKELRENFYIGPVNYNKYKMTGQISIVPYSYFASNGVNYLKNRDEIYNEKNLITDTNNLYINELLEIFYDYDVLILDEAHYIRNQGKLWHCVKSIIEKNEPENSEDKLKIFMTGTPVFNINEDYNNITSMLRHNNQTYKSTKTLQSESNCYDNILKIQIVKNGEESGYGITPNDKETSIINEIYTVIEYQNEEGDIIEKNKYGRLTGFLKRIAASSFYSLKEFVTNHKIPEDMLEDDEYYSDWDYQSVSDCQENNQNDLKDLLDDWDTKDDSKVNALTSLLSHLNKNNNTGKPFKAIIFSCFIFTCDYLEKCLESNYHVYSISGKTKTNDVNDQKAAFEKETKPSVLICSDSAKEGHNLQFCHYLIHYDLPFSPAVINQRNGRIYRKGQEDNPEVFYLPLKIGYDKRLFGEIIVNKCKIIEKMSEKKLLPPLNILPSDADNYIENCINSFVTDYFSSGIDEKKDKAKEKAKKFLKSHFSEESENGILSWKIEKAEKLFNDINDGLVSENDYESKISEIYITEIKQNSNSVSLSKIYQSEYNKKVSECVKTWFGETTETDKEIECFINCCKNYVGKTETKYCHDYLSQNSESNLSFSDYKKQFKPLKEKEN